MSSSASELFVLGLGQATALAALALIAGAEISIILGVYAAVLVGTVLGIVALYALHSFGVTMGPLVDE